MIEFDCVLNCVFWIAKSKHSSLLLMKTTYLWNTFNTNYAYTFEHKSVPQNKKTYMVVLKAYILKRSKNPNSKLNQSRGPI